MQTADSIDNDDDEVQIISIKRPKKSGDDFHSSEKRIKQEAISPEHGRSLPTTSQRLIKDEPGGHVAVNITRDHFIGNRDRSPETSRNRSRSPNYKRFHSIGGHYHHGQRPFLVDRSHWRPRFLASGRFQNFHDNNFRPSLPGVGHPTRQFRLRGFIRQRFPQPIYEKNVEKGRNEFLPVQGVRKQLGKIQPLQNSSPNKQTNCRHSQRFKCRNCRSPSTHENEVVNAKAASKKGKRVSSPVIKAQISKTWKKIRKGKKEREYLSSTDSLTSSDTDSDRTSNCSTSRNKTIRKDKSPQNLIAKRIGLKDNAKIIKTNTKTKKRSKESRKKIRSKSSSSQSSSCESFSDDTSSTSEHSPKRKKGKHKKHLSTDQNRSRTLTPESQSIREVLDRHGKSINARPEHDSQNVEFRDGIKNRIKIEREIHPSLKVEASNESQLISGNKWPPAFKPPTAAETGQGRSNETEGDALTTHDRAGLAATRLAQRLHQRKIDLAERLNKEKVEAELRDKLVTISDDEDTGEDSQKITVQSTEQKIFRMKLVNGVFLPIDVDGNPITSAEKTILTSTTNICIPTTTSRMKLVDGQGFVPMDPTESIESLVLKNTLPNVPTMNLTLPTTSLTGPEQVIFRTMIPPPISTFYGSPQTPIVNPMAIPPTSSSGLINISHSSETTHENKTERLLFARMKIHEKHLQRITNTEALMQYIWNHGYEELQKDDSDAILFNQIAKKCRGMIGIPSLCQVICYGHTELETYYCRMCQIWTTVSEIFIHLESTLHRMNYMFRNYKMYHKRAEDETDSVVRNKLLESFAEQIWKIEGSGICTNRMNVVLNKASIQKIWPEYENFVDNSWKLIELEGHNETSSNDSFIDGRSTIQPPRLKSPLIKAATPQIKKEDEYCEKVYHGREVFHDDDYDIQEEDVIHVPASDASVHDRSRLTATSHHQASPADESWRHREDDDLDIHQIQSCHSQSSNCPAEPEKQLSSTFDPDEFDAVTNFAPNQLESDLSDEDKDNVYNDPAQLLNAVRDWDERAKLRASQAQISSLQSTASRHSPSSSSVGEFICPTKQNSSSESFDNSRITEMTERRMVVASMVKLQDEYDKNGSIQTERFFEICKDVGLSDDVVMRNRLLRETAVQFDIDLLPTFTERQKLQLSNATPTAIPSQGESRESTLKVFDSAIQPMNTSEMSAILKNVAYSQPESVRRCNNSSFAIAEQESCEDNDPSPMGELFEEFLPKHQSAVVDEELDISRRMRRNPEEVVQLNEEFIPDSLIYPSFDEEPVEPECHRDPTEIDSTINRLTFAFAPHRKHPHPHSDMNEPHEYPQEWDESYEYSDNRYEADYDAPQHNRRIFFDDANNYGHFYDYGQDDNDYGPFFYDQQDSYQPPMRTCAEETLALEFQKKNAKSSRAKQRLNELEQLAIDAESSSQALDASEDIDFTADDFFADDSSTTKKFTNAETINKINEGVPFQTKEVSCKAPTTLAPPSTKNDSRKKHIFGAGVLLELSKSNEKDLTSAPLSTKDNDKEMMNVPNKDDVPINDPLFKQPNNLSTDNETSQQEQLPENAHESSDITELPSSTSSQQQLLAPTSDSKRHQRKMERALQYRQKQQTDKPKPNFEQDKLSSETSSQQQTMGQSIPLGISKRQQKKMSLSLQHQQHKRGSCEDTEKEKDSEILNDEDQTSTQTANKAKQRSNRREPSTSMAATGANQIPLGRSRFFGQARDDRSPDSIQKGETSRAPIPSLRNVCRPPPPQLNSIRPKSHLHPRFLHPPQPLAFFGRSEYTDSYSPHLISAESEEMSFEMESYENTEMTWQQHIPHQPASSQFYSTTGTFGTMPSFSASSLVGSISEIPTPLDPPPPPPPEPQPVPPPPDFIPLEPAPPVFSGTNLLLKPPPPPPPPPSITPTKSPPPQKRTGSIFSNEQLSIIYGLDKKPIPPSAIFPGKSSSSAPISPTVSNINSPAVEILSAQIRPSQSQTDSPSVYSDPRRRKRPVPATPLESTPPITPASSMTTFEPAVSNAADDGWDILGQFSSMLTCFKEKQKAETRK